MASTIKVKRSSTASAVPSSLAEGELAANTSDGKLFLGKSDSSVVEIGAGGGGALNPVEAEMLMRQTSSGAAAEITYPSQVKTIRLETPTYAYQGSVQYQEFGSGGIGGSYGPFGAGRLGNGQTEVYLFKMPSDFTELVSAEVLAFGYTSDTATKNYEVEVWYGSTGATISSKNTALNQSYDSVSEALIPLDISNLFTGISAGDGVVINFKSATNYIYYCGIQISYK